MTRPHDTHRTLRITPRAAALKLSSGEGPLRTEWRGPAPRIRHRGGATEIGYDRLGRLRALVTPRSSLALTLDPRIPLDLEIAAIGGDVIRHAGAGAASLRLRFLGGAAGLSVAAAP